MEWRCWLHSIPAPVSLLYRHLVQSYAAWRYNAMPLLLGVKISSAPEACLGANASFLSFLKSRISSTTTERLFHPKIIWWLNTAAFHC